MSAVIGSVLPCTTLTARVTTTAAATEHLLEPCETWPLSVQANVSHEFSSVEAQRARQRQWLAYVFEQAPWLMTQSPDTRDALKHVLESADSWSLEQTVHLPFLARELAALGYADVKIANEADLLHGPHRTFRNEWWSLAGRMVHGGAAVTWQVWRRTLVPPTVWPTDHTDARAYSAVRFSWSSSSSDASTLRHSPWLLESWGLGGVTHEPRFQAYCGQLHRLVSRDPDTLFPMDLQWAGLYLSNLDYVKPRLMLHSNCCLSCSDGVGLKMYMYPEVKNDTFTGYFSHAWEAGVMPEGFASHAALRSIANLEKQWGPLSRVERWLSVKIQLDNQVDLWAFFMSYETPHPHRVVISTREGAMVKLAQHEVELVCQDGLTNAVLRHPRFNLQWVMDSPHLVSTRDTLTTLSHGFVSGLWREDVAGADPVSHFVKGAVVLETPDLRTYDERAKELLTTVFPQAGETVRRHFENAYFSSSDDVWSSVAVWLLPLLLTVGLCLTLIYVSLTPPQRYPWIRATTATTTATTTTLNT